MRIASITSYEFNGTKLSTAYWPKATPLFRRVLASITIYQVIGH